ncbi:hypothetical protein JB92DRAFT_2881396 [Gautieria morchelliformis]|nr:hypothetical protein JB92DRAFT_2881396 [Gautieria morchelliformis]
MFKFTFSSGSAIFNPFAAKAEEEERIQQSLAPQTITRKLPAPPRRTSPPPSISENVQPSRKRGWAPTTSLASAATSQPTSTNGWIDTPSRYLEAASQSHKGGGEDVNDVGAGLPPAKRRKTLTDTIISTAFSAALIGTAVGMTAYRMWRDRGKPTAEDDSIPMEPPPPYEREEWVNDVRQSKPANRAPRLHRKPKSVARRTPRRRMAHTAVSPSRPPVRAPSPLRFTSFQPEDIRDDEDGLEHQIDWMGDKIRSLIEEGQRALGKEVVVMNEDENNEEGAVDDGMDGWEEEGHQGAGPSSPSSSGYHRQCRIRPSQALNTSLSPPSRLGVTLPDSYTGTSTSPQPKRHHSSINGKRSQGSSASASPHLNAPNSTRLGGRSSDGTQTVKVIYEPTPSFSSLNHQRGANFQDEDSRGLAERMENIRKAYRIQ